MQIYYVDENQDFAEIMGSYLEDFGFNVRLLQDGEKLMAELKQETPDLLICSTTLEPESGYDLCRTLRLQPQWDSLPVLMAGPVAANHEQTKFLMNHGIHYVLKYKGPEKWFEKIHIILQKERAS